jgi:hypothetical protein
LSCKVSVVGNNEEDEAKQATDALTSCLLKIADLSNHSMAPPAMVAIAPGNLDGLDLDGIAAPSPPILRKLGASAPDLLSKDTPLNDKLHQCVKLANLGWDCTAESLYLSTITKNGR